MNEVSDRHGHERGDRALQLLEQGLSKSIIAERMGVKPRHVGGMIQRARQRREKAKEGVAQ